MRGLFVAEIEPPQGECATDAFYQQTDFSLDLFLALKTWHEQLLNDPNYSDLIDLFGSNLLPTTDRVPQSAWSMLEANGAVRQRYARLLTMPFYSSSAF